MSSDEELNANAWVQFRHLTTDLGCIVRHAKGNEMR